MNSAAVIIAAGAAVAIVTACSPSRPTAAAVAISAAPTPAPAPFGPTVLGGTPADMPRAVVYRMSGDYSQNVPVNLGPDGNITSYPAPSDLRGAAPVAVGHGLWLDRRGVGPRSVFTRYTYREYMNLPEAPSPQQLRDAIIPGAHITSVYTLPMAAGADSAEVAGYINLNPELFQ